MRKAILGLVSLVLALAILVGCSRNQMSIEKPNDFSIVLKYGIGAKNVLDTKGGTFTKDLISAGTKTTTLKLTNDELATVYDDMRKIGIMNYPEVFQPGGLGLTQRFVSPHPTYDLTIKYNRKQKRVFWEDESLSETSEAKQLRVLINQVISVIERKDEFKKLPEPQGGYM